MRMQSSTVKDFRKTFMGGTGFGGHSTSAINVTADNELYNDYKDVLNKSQVSLNRSKFYVERKLKGPGSSDMPLINVKRVNNSPQKRAALVDKKDSLYITMTGTSISGDIASEYFEKPKVKLQVGNRLSSTSKPSKYAIIRTSAMLDSVHAVDLVDGKDASCCVSMQSLNSS